MSAADPRDGDPRFDANVLVLVQRALLAQIPADAPEASPEHAPRHLDGCRCRDCRAYELEVAAVADAHHDGARAHQEERADLALDEDVTLYPDPCPLHLMARSGVAEQGARYARTPAAPAAIAPSAARPRFVPAPPTRRHAEVFA